MYKTSECSSKTKWAFKRVKVVDKKSRQRFVPAFRKEEKKSRQRFLPAHSKEEKVRQRFIPAHRKGD